jgi:hypothetical protein
MQLAPLMAQETETEDPDYDSIKTLETLFV